MTLATWEDSPSRRQGDVSPKKITAPLDIYVRVSDVGGRSGDSFISPKDQEERCRALATARGYAIGQVFTDLDVSGGTMDRPAFNEALARITDGVSGGIIVARMDRFSRTLTGAIHTLEVIEKAGGYLIECDGDWDTSTPMGRFGRDLVIRLSQLYREQIADTWVTSKRHAVSRGIHVSSRVPPGYMRPESDKELSLKTGNMKKKVLGPLVPDPTFGPIVTEAFAMAARGEKYNRIAAYLTEAGLPSGTSGGAVTVWESNRIGRLLANRAYLGEARSGHGDVNPDAHPALVDLLTWNLAQRESHGPTLSIQETRLLAGLCRCAACSYGMRSQPPRNGAVGVYRCRTSSPSGRCESPSTISQTRLEEHVIARFLERVSDLRGVQVADDDDGFQEAAQAATEAERLYRETLTNTELAATLGATDFGMMVASLKERWQEALVAVPVQRPHAATRTIDIAGLVAELQRRGDVQGLRELLASEIQAVFVRPAASRARSLPIEDRVCIVWSDDPPLVLPKRGERFETRSYDW
jgi:DNA invertase Pin-like site-specific DNA recombinase